MTAYLADLGIVCALGAGRRAVGDALFGVPASPLVWDDASIPGRRVMVGAVAAELPEIGPDLAPWRSRDNRLALHAALQMEPAIQAARSAWGARRIGVVLGTSTAGIAEGDAAVSAWLRDGVLPAGYDYRQQELASPAEFLARRFGLGGPSLVVSTACTSSGNAILAAARLLRDGWCDAVITGGADSLCRLTLNGFGALEALSDGLCNPFSAHRRGINIGEGAALFLLTREPAAVALLGGGASSDAHHISAPEPGGRGAVAAMGAALASAGLPAGAIGYVNLHGTATAQNDAMESVAMHAVFAGQVPACSSTKPLTGHTLGAASAVELAFCWLALARGEAGTPVPLPPHLWDGAPDPALPPLPLAAAGACLPGGGYAMMSNSFAFGGNNVSLIIGRTP